jgi:hypothetical protein
LRRAQHPTLQCRQRACECLIATLREEIWSCYLSEEQHCRQLIAATKASRTLNWGTGAQIDLQTRSVMNVHGAVDFQKARQNSGFAVADPSSSSKSTAIQRTISSSFSFSDILIVA